MFFFGSGDYPCDRRSATSASMMCSRGDGGAPYFPGVLFGGPGLRKNHENADGLLGCRGGGALFFVGDVRVDDMLQGRRGRAVFSKIVRNPTLSVDPLQPGSWWPGVTE